MSAFELQIHTHLLHCCTHASTQNKTEKKATSRPLTEIGSWTISGSKTTKISLYQKLSCSSHTIHIRQQGSSW